MSPSATGMEKLYEMDQSNKIMSMSSKNSIGKHRYQTSSNLGQFDDYAKVDMPPK